MRLIDADALLTTISWNERPDEPGLYKRGKESVIRMIKEMPSLEMPQEADIREEIKKAYQQGYMDGALYGMTGVKGEGNE